MTIWELRFSDGRGASFYTNEDVSADIGQQGIVRTIEVAAQASVGTALADARRCLEERQTQLLTSHMGAVAFALRHDV
jgi:hypothetical protein